MLRFGLGQWDGLEDVRCRSNRRSQSTAPPFLLLLRTCRDAGGSNGEADVGHIAAGQDAPLRGCLPEVFAEKFRDYVSIIVQNVVA
jgi:hypothetical protein